MWHKRMRLEHDRFERRSTVLEGCAIGFFTAYKFLVCLPVMPMMEKEAREKKNHLYGHDIRAYSRKVPSAFHPL